MTSLRILAIGLLVIMVQMARVPVFAQSSPQPALTNSGNKAWIVKKNDLTDFSGKNDSILADFDTKAQAEMVADRLNKDEKNWQRWSYVATERPKTGSDAGGTIDLGPNIESPVPGSPATSGSRTGSPSVAGSLGKGTIGNFRVTMEFGEGGVLTVSGEATGKGTWEQTGSVVSLRTETSSYRGNIEGNIIYGLRFSRKDDSPVSQWRVTLSNPRATLQAQLREIKTLWSSIESMRSPLIEIQAGLYKLTAPSWNVRRDRTWPPEVNAAATIPAFKSVMLELESAAQGGMNKEWPSVRTYWVEAVNDATSAKQIEKLLVYFAKHVDNENSGVMRWWRETPPKWLNGRH